MSNSNYYEQDSYPAVERATLAESITFSSISNITGKFFLKIMSPDLDTSITYDNNTNYIKKGSYASNYIELTIPAYMLFSFMGSLSFENINDISHTISGLHTHSHDKTGNKYMLDHKEKEYTIPKGTNFLVSFLGGDMEVEKIHIIGIEL